MGPAAARLAVGLTGGLALVALVGIIALAWREVPVPDVLQVVTGSLTGGLVGLLVPTRTEGP